MAQHPAVVERSGSSELGALAELAGEGLAGMVSRVEELHGAIAGRSFGPTGAAAAAPRATHDVIAAGVYGALRGAAGLLASGVAAGVRASGGGPRLSAGPRGRLVQGALNGVVGDRLEERGSALRVGMAVRAGAADVPLRPDALAAAFPEATARPVVFVHGLCESDASWSLYAERHAGTYLTRAVPQAGGTGVTIRYNTGLPVQENGRRLDMLLEELVAAWPVPVEDLALVGHSMGGLVIRGAGHAAAEHGHRWPSLVHSTVCLGTPHLGAPLEQAAARGAQALRAVPETRPLASVLDTRSVGIKDLRQGSLVPLLPGSRHHAVAATLTTSPHHPVGRVLGDLLVLTPSAHGIRRRRRVIAFEPDRCRHVGGHDHFDLLNSPQLDPWLVEWLAPPD